MSISTFAWRPFEPWGSRKTLRPSPPSAEPSMIATRPYSTTPFTRCRRSHGRTSATMSIDGVSTSKAGRFPNNVRSRSWSVSVNGSKTPFGACGRTGIVPGIGTSVVAGRRLPYVQRVTNSVSKHQPGEVNAAVESGAKSPKATAKTSRCGFTISQGSRIVCRAHRGCGCH